MSGAGRGTNAIGEVCNQVVDLNLPALELAVQPVAVALVVSRQPVAGKERTIW
jgi:hypothetical protein